MNIFQSHKDRPRVRPERTLLDQVFITVAIALMVGGFILVVVSWASLPARIPIHWNAAGEVDGWGPRGVIWLLPAIGLLLVGGLLAVMRVPWLANVPVTITERNAAAQYGLIVRLLAVLSAGVASIFFILVVETIQTARGGGDLLGPWMLPVFLAPTIGALIWYLVAAIRTARADDHEDLSSDA